MPLSSFRVKDYLNCSNKKFQPSPLPPSQFHAQKLKKNSGSLSFALKVVYCLPCSSIVSTYPNSIKIIRGNL